MQETFVAVAPHRVERVGEPKQHGPRRAEQDEPEQGAEHRVVAVFERGFDRRLGDPGCVESRGIARDDPADVLPCRREVAARQVGVDAAHVFGQALRAEREIKRQAIDQPGGQQIAQDERQADPGQHCSGPGGDAENFLQSQSAPRPPARFERRRQPAEADQRVPARRLAEAAVERHRGQRGKHQGNQGRGRKRVEQHAAEAFGVSGARAKIAPLCAGHVASRGADFRGVKMMTGVFAALRRQLSGGPHRTAAGSAQ